MIFPRFAIFYNDGRVVYGGGPDDEPVTLTFSRAWLEAPSDGVSHIVVEDGATGRNTRKGAEYYYQLPAEHHGRGEIGASMKIGPYLRQLADGGGLVKFGGWTSGETFDAIARRAALDDYIKPASAQRREPLEDEAD